MAKNNQLNFYKVWKDRTYGNTLYPNMQGIWFLHKDKNTGLYNWMDITEDETYDIQFDNVFDAENYLNSLVKMEEINKWCRQ